MTIAPGVGAGHGARVAHAHFAAGFDQAFPAPVAEGLEQEHFDPFVVGEKPGFDDLGIVEHGQVAGLEIAGQVAKMAVFDHATGAIDHHHARGVAFGQRTAGNERLGQVKIIIGDEMAQGGKDSLTTNVHEPAQIKRWRGTLSLSVH